VAPETDPPPGPDPKRRIEPAIFLLTGIPASGKSSVGAALAARFQKAVHIDGDVIRDMIVRGREDMAPDASREALTQLRLRYRLAVQLAEGFFDAGFVAIVQDNVLGPRLTEFVDAVSRRPFYVIVLAPDADSVAEREAGREKSAYGSGWTVQELDRGFRETTPRIGRWLDTTGLSVDETVARILAEI
jgi:predicted kinase